MCENCHAKKWLNLTKGLYSQSKEDERDKHIYDTMYKTWWLLFQVLHPSFLCINPIQKVRNPVSDFEQGLLDLKSWKIHAHLMKMDKTIDWNRCRKHPNTHNRQSRNYFFRGSMPP